MQRRRSGSNLFLGQGPWTPWQMLAWGACGAAGALAAPLIRGRIPFAFSAASSASPSAPSWTSRLWLRVSPHTSPAFAAIHTRGIPFDLAHAIGNVVIALAVGPELRRCSPLRPATADDGGVGVRALAVVAAASLFVTVPVEQTDVFVASQQQADGGWPAGRRSEPSLTAWAVLGLAAAGRPAGRAASTSTRSAGTRRNRSRCACSHSERSGMGGPRARAPRASATCGRTDRAAGQLDDLGGARAAVRGTARRRVHGSLPPAQARAEREAGRRRRAVHRMPTTPLRPCRRCAPPGWERAHGRCATRSRSSVASRPATGDSRSFAGERPTRGRRPGRSRRTRRSATLRRGGHARPAGPPPVRRQLPLLAPVRSNGDLGDRAGDPSARPQAVPAHGAAMSPPSIRSSRRLATSESTMAATRRHENQV